MWESFCQLPNCIYEEVDVEINKIKLIGWSWSSSTPFIKPNTTYSWVRVRVRVRVKS